MRYEDYKDMVEALATVFNEDPQIVWRIVQDNPPMTKVEVTHVADAEEGKQTDLEDLIEELEGQEITPERKAKLEEAAYREFVQFSSSEKFEVLFNATLKRSEILDAVVATAIENHDNANKLERAYKELHGTIDALWHQVEQWKEATRGLVLEIEDLQYAVEQLKNKK